MRLQPLHDTVSPFERIRRTDRGEHWSARDLMPLLGYTTWQHFADTIERAKTACANTHREVGVHFAPTEGGDFRLTRFAAYLVAMNGDPRRAAVARAQTYFTAKIRDTARPRPRAELTPREIAELVIREADRADTAENRAAALEPDANAWRTLAAAKGDYAVADAAKLLSRDERIEIGEIRLFAFLADQGWIYRDKGDGAWRAYQSAVAAGRMTERAQSHLHPRTGELILDPPQVRVTVAGVRLLHSLFADRLATA
ncbi:phage antirepressor KilAC domain-containing protein [Glycomyces sp. NPDC046736]|uniref:phage antirepressor KilAC domain-containing protein n=1 Tax=Glycomyces sp. NPDC046736 TaxID=3155615 RepID=UPI0033F85931